MPDRVRITDVSPRDGLQNEAGVIATADKVRLIELLARTGVDEIEATSFVSPKWVPQLADAAEVVRGLAALVRGGPYSPSQREGAGGWADRHQEPSGGQAPASLDPPPRWQPPLKKQTTLGQAKALRRAATGPEKALWEVLRQREWMGAKFRRQHPFGPFILDFFCQDKLLAVEVDGQTHRGAIRKSEDAQRDLFIRSWGVEVLRFTNNDVLGSPSGVAARIRDVLRVRPSLGTTKPLPPTPHPLPLGGGFDPSAHLHGPPIPLLSALVPNERGLDTCLAANAAAGGPLLGKVSVFTAASETFSRKNTNASIAETIERFKPVISRAHEAALLVRGYLSCIIRCPFEGDIAPGAVAECSGRLLELGVDELDLGDTIGAGTPETVRVMLDAVSRVCPLNGSRVPLTLHLHDTFGQAAACVLAALDMGVRSFDGSAAGLGGCPYASTTKPDGTVQRAPGNISTELLVRTIHSAGYTTGVDLAALDEAAAFARQIVATARAAARPGPATGGPA
ncbi:MAG: DUF559 domain-containing protein [Phycisphaerales bacterium]